MVSNQINGSVEEFNYKDKDNWLEDELSRSTG